nr:hydantoinase B/oxoprolinase family protein [Burkholderia ubonensis]
MTTIVGSRGQQADIGGTTPGLMLPDSTSIDEEGVLRDAGRRRVWGDGCRMTMRFDRGHAQ